MATFNVPAADIVRSRTKSREEVVQDDTAHNIEEILRNINYQVSRGFFTYTTQNFFFESDVAKSIEDAFKKAGYQITVEEKLENQIVNPATMYKFSFPGPQNNNPQIGD